MTRAAQLQYEAAVAHFSHLFEGIPAIALTLTFSPRVEGQRLTVDVAEASIRLFRRRINKVSRGREFGEKYRCLRLLAVREGGEGFGSKRIHYHLTIEVPPNREPREFADWCTGHWRKMKWGRDAQVVTRTDADAGWIDYSLKLRDKPLYADAIDWINSSGGAN